MQGIRIKEIHTGYVTAHAIALAKHLHLSPHDVALAEIMGLFHDVGRFRQYSLYKTLMMPNQKITRILGSRSCRSLTS